MQVVLNIYYHTLLNYAYCEYIIKLDCTLKKTPKKENAIITIYIYIYIYIYIKNKIIKKINIAVRQKMICTAVITADSFDYFLVLEKLTVDGVAWLTPELQNRTNGYSNCDKKIN